MSPHCRRNPLESLGPQNSLQRRRVCLRCPQGFKVEARDTGERGGHYLEGPGFWRVDSRGIWGLENYGWKGNEFLVRR